MALLVMLLMGTLGGAVTARWMRVIRRASTQTMDTDSNVPFDQVPDALLQTPRDGSTFRFAAVKRSSELRYWLYP